MTRAHRIAVVLLAAASVAVPARAQQRAADGVAINDAGEPQYSTFSLCAIVGSSRVDLQACKLEYSIVSPK